MSDDSAQERARLAEAARREADEAAASAKEQAESAADQLKTNLLTGEGGEEAIRQLGVIYGGLIGIAVVMLQPFLGARSLDTPARISVIAFAVAIPLLAALVMVNRQESFRRRVTPSVNVAIARVIAQGAAFVGIAAGFWHIDWIAGVAFLATAFVAMFVHSAGFTRLEWPPARAAGGGRP